MKYFIYVGICILFFANCFNGSPNTEKESSNNNLEPTYTKRGAAIAAATFMYINFELPYFEAIVSGRTFCLLCDITH